MPGGETRLAEAIRLALACAFLLAVVAITWWRLQR